MTDDILPASNEPRPSASWTTTMWRVSQSPVSDLVRGRVTGRLSVVETIGQAELPAELATLIQTVVSGTRLWPVEQVDVARELAGHFRDGLDAGASAQELQERFGDPRLAARMIRKSRIRCRPAWWHAWRYALLGVGLLLLMYLGLTARFFLSKPTITRHYVQELNERTKAIPEEQWAWPLYRQAQKAMKPYPKLEKDQPNDMTEGWWTSETNRVDRDSLPWKQMQTFVEENQAALSLIHQGAKKPARGIIYNDPEDNPNATIEPNSPVISTLLTQVQEMRSFARLVTADATIAAAAGDGDRAAADFQTLVRIAEQTPGFCLIEELVATAILQITMATIRDVLEDDPQLLTDKQLVEIAHQLAVYHGGGTIRFDLRGEQWMLEDLLQRCYTDDGNGDGTLTPEGFKLLAQCASNDWSGDRKDQQANIAAAVLAPATMLRSMSRRESQEIQDRLIAESTAVHQGPLYTWTTPDPIDEFFRKERPKFTGHQRVNLVPAYSVPMLFIPALQQCFMAAERLCQARDGTLTAIALELYRRRHGDWPQSLEPLVPQYLPELPLDRFTGEALGYRLPDGRPVVYAVGMDHQDDGGRHSSLENGSEFHRHIFTKPQKSLAPGEGYDWLLFPRPRQAPKEGSAPE